MCHAAIARVGWGGLVTLFPFLTPIVRPISQRFPDPAAHRVSSPPCLSLCSKALIVLADVKCCHNGGLSALLGTCADVAGQEEAAQRGRAADDGCAQRAGGRWVFLSKSISVSLSVHTLGMSFQQPADLHGNSWSASQGSIITAGKIV